jgi:molybdate transport system substrate-binding protein
MEKIAVEYEKKMNIKVVLNIASSAVLARQIEAGAKADIFLSADEQWMDYLDSKNLISKRSRCDLVGNDIILIAPVNKVFQIKMKADFDFASAFNGHLAIGEPCSVPVGRYAKEAMVSLGWYKPIASRVIPCESTRSVLAMVERGEVDAGIVYTSDAVVSKKVTVVGVFPESTHRAIRYPVAALKGAGTDASGFLDYLKAKESMNIFTGYGFKLLPPVAVDKKGPPDANS